MKQLKLSSTAADSLPHTEQPLCCRGHPVVQLKAVPPCTQAEPRRQTRTQLRPVPQKNGAQRGGRVQNRFAVTFDSSRLTISLPEFPPRAISLLAPVPVCAPQWWFG